MIYLDTSALVKLTRAEPASDDLAAWLAERRSAALVASALVEVELARALRRHAPEALGQVPAVLASLYLLDVDSPVRSAAAGYPDPRLRSLDALHLATAQLAASGDEPLEAFVAYDDRLLAAARVVGISVASPGRT